MPSARALGSMQLSRCRHARDLAAIRDAVVDSRGAVDEVVTIRPSPTVAQAIAEVLAMRPVLDKVEAGLRTWSVKTRRLRRVGCTLLVALALLTGTGGVWLQRETVIWTPLADIENRERHCKQITHCIEVARTRKRGMSSHDRGHGLLSRENERPKLRGSPGSEAPE